MPVAAGMATAIVATAFGGPEVLASVETEVPPPGAHEVTVRIRAAAINPIDYKLYSGAFGADPSQLPKRVGLEAAGVVTAVGDDATAAVGDEVIVYGAGAAGLFATEVTVPDAALTPKPAGLGWEPAAGLLLAGVTAVHTLEAAGVKDGDTVLVHGAAGSVGLLAAQLAVARGARVIGTAAPSRHDALRGYGIEPVAYGDGLAERVRALAPDGVSAAIDTVGTDEAVDVSLEVVADRSRIATIAAFGRAGEAGIKALGGGPGADPGTELRAQARAELARLAGEGKVEVVVARTYPLAETADAMAFVAEGHAGGKVVLLP
ncbi:MAG: NADP-dependent oxidoreductase [Pseudonocardia sp.]|nr:NADP-dependent oxidoreductase [Pseudonocardia sp.]